MRGLRALAQRRGALLGFHPRAGAGSAKELTMCVEPWGVHPRAGAGSASFGSMRTLWRRVHPCSRVVCPRSTGWGSPRSGSSPLPRGLLWCVSGYENLPRLIPAPAGSAPMRGVFPVPCKVHPRARGVCTGVKSVVGSTTGSSPRQRGLLTIFRPSLTCGRFIPAGAGFAHRQRWASRSSAVHPRWRGVCLMYPGRCSMLDGSSPLARGLSVNPRD